MRLKLQQLNCLMQREVLVVAIIMRQKLARAGLDATVIERDPQIKQQKDQALPISQIKMRQAHLFTEHVTQLPMVTMTVDIIIGRTEIRIMELLVAIRLAVAMSILT